MAVQQRREKARVERRRLIVSTARQLAEAEGWDAVTTRRLAEEVEYSQPVLYSHFTNMNAIETAVALEGFEELAAVLTAARAEARSAEEELRSLAVGYLAFASEHPALYQVMFVRQTELRFATADGPAPLRASYEVLRGAVEPFTRFGLDDETVAEVFWSSLHGLATLQAGSRLRPPHQQQRVDLLIRLLTG